MLGEFILFVQSVAGESVVHHLNFALVSFFSHPANIALLLFGLAFRAKKVDST